LFAHCFTCSKDLVAAGRISAELNAVGIGVLRFDFTGLGASGGDFANTDFSSNLDDLRAAADWLREHHGAPQLLVGHSLGGAASIVVAGDVPDVRGVVTIGAPADVDHLRHLFAADLDRIADEGEATVDIGGRPFTIRREFLRDLERHVVTERAARLGAAVLVMHSPTDAVVGIEHAARLYTAARHPKSFVSLDGADHLLTDRNQATSAGRIIAAWFERYLLDERVRRGATVHPAPAPSAPVVVAETGEGTFLNHVVVGEHRFLADEPESVGGFDAGPTPYDLLGAALGACTSMTIRMYAQRKGWPLERVTVEVTHAKVHAADGDAAVDGGTSGLIDGFHRRITIDGPLDDTQRTGLLRIADRCPVHRTLHAGARITSELVSGG
jgi:putative redox protein